MSRSRSIRTVLAFATFATVAALSGCARADRANLDFVLKDMNGDEVRLAAFAGRPLLINFWATWCPPCKVEVPWFIEMAEKYKSRDLAILGVSIDDTPDDIKKFAADYKINYPLLVGNGRDDLMAEYEAGLVVPVTWLIRPDGTVLETVKGIHSREWFDAKVQELFID
jgi:peroxiredoxin